LHKLQTVYKIFVGTPERKRPLWRPRSRWEDNIKTGLKEVGCDGVEWARLAQYRVQLLDL